MTPESRPASLTFDSIRVQYPSGVQTTDADFSISPGERFAILGPSGSGKTTLVKVATGLIRGLDTGSRRFGLQTSVYHSGRLLINGRDASGEEPSSRGISLISQHSNLYPHLTVRQNLKLIAPRGTKDQAILGLLEELGIAHVMDRHPASISGGEGQRVSLAKALLRPASSCVAMDEPMTGIDQHLRIGLASLIRAVHKRHPTTLLLVSHDQETTLSLADRIAYIDRGRVLQLSSPEVLVNKPAHPLVASAIDPFFRVRLDAAVATDAGFLGGGVALLGPPLPATTNVVVVNTRLVHISESSAAPLDAWCVAVASARHTYIGGQPAIAVLPIASEREWYIPVSSSSLPSNRFAILVPKSSIWAFDADGRLLGGLS